MSWSPEKERKALRRHLIERDGTRCFHCKRPTRLPEGFEEPRPEHMTIDHFPAPRRTLPKTEWLNPARCVIACHECNQARG